MNSETRIFKDHPGDPLRLMMIVTSNAYQDREGDIVTEKALSEYVDSCWKEGDFIGNNPLLVWHAGDPIGDIIYAEMSGPFLIEIARERSNQMVNLAKSSEQPLYIQVKAVWDALEREPDRGASHAFFFNTKETDGIYQRIAKVETSTLPRSFAANVITDSDTILKGV